MPTMLALAGASLPEHHRLDGIDLSPVLFEQQRLGPRTLFWQYNHRAAVRQGSWKLVRDASEQPDTTLYDLASDHGEKQYLADIYPERVQAMLAAFEAWQDDVTSGVTAQPNR